MGRRLGWFSGCISAKGPKKAVSPGFGRWVGYIASRSGAWYFGEDPQEIRSHLAAAVSWVEYPGFDPRYSGGHWNPRRPHISPSLWVFATWLVKGLGRLGTCTSGKARRKLRGTPDSRSPHVGSRIGVPRIPTHPEDGAGAGFALILDIYRRDRRMWSRGRRECTSCHIFAVVVGLPPSVLVRANLG